MRLGRRVYLNRQPWLMSIDMVIVDDRTDASYVLVPKEEWQEVSPSDQAPRESIINLPLDAGQQMIDDLWRMGYRPSSGVSSTGQDEAQKSHISDLRRVIFSLLSIEDRGK